MKDENKPVTRAELRKELNDVVRKKDLQKELKDVVRKKDIEGLERFMRKAPEIFATKEWVLENMATKKDFEKILTLIDAIAQRLDEMSLDFKFLVHRTDRTEDTGENHERRIVKLERKVLT